MDKYIDARLAAGAENATVNKEINILRRAFRLAKLSAQWPERLPETNVRRGFLTETEYDRLAAECAKVGLWLRTLLALGASFGFRKGEMRSLRVRQVDLAERIITLDPGTTKNGEGRDAGITEELLPACVSDKAPDDFVLTYDDGKPIGDFRKAWKRACVAAGVDITPHDLRRTAARNLRRLGVSEGVIMRIGGWRTANVFERYNIKNRADVKEATALLDKKREENGSSVEPLQKDCNRTQEQLQSDRKSLN